MGHLARSLMRVVLLVCNTPLDVHQVQKIAL